MFESVEEVDQIEMEPKNGETKQVPKLPNGALQNGTSSPDSGHPSSRNFSITSGLSDGSFSTEDSAAQDTTPRPAAVPQVSQSSVKPAGGESGGQSLEKDGQVEGEVKDKRVEKEKASDVTKTSKHAAETGDKIDTKKTSLKPETKDNIEESQAVKAAGTKHEDKSLDGNIKGDESLETLEVAKALKPEEANVEKMKEVDESKTSKEVLVTGGKEKIFKGPGAPEMENLTLSADTRVVKAREAYSAAQKDEPHIMTESDESPSAIEMEEIPKAKVSMVPWSRKGHCETSSSSENSPPHVELRQKEEQRKLSPEGTESNLSEPEMESLYPPFDSLAASENTKNQVTSQVSTGSPFSV